VLACILENLTSGCVSDALFHQFGVLLKNVFDTQIAYAVVARSQVARSLFVAFSGVCSLSWQGQLTPLPVSLSTLLRMYAMGKTNPVKELAR
jgi:hypothetical protein